LFAFFEFSLDNYFCLHDRLLNQRSPAELEALGWNLEEGGVTTTDDR
jgi:hypothetical protein